VFVCRVQPVGAFLVLLIVQLEAHVDVDGVGDVAVVDFYVEGPVRALYVQELVVEEELGDKAARPGVLLAAKFVH